MTSFSIPLTQVQTLFLIFVRVGGLIMTAPLLDSRGVPIAFKLGLAFSLSIILLPLVAVRPEVFEGSALAFMVGLVGEVFIGIIIGVAIRLLFSAVQLAGQLAGFQMGFSIANVLDSVSNAQISVISQLQNIVAVLLFFSCNAHYWLFSGVVDSFVLVPPFSFQMSYPLVDQLLRLTGTMFIIAVKVGAPVIVALLLTTVSLGLVARVVPQINIFIVAFPIKIAVGLVFIGVTLPSLAAYLGELYAHLGTTIHELLRASSL